MAFSYRLFDTKGDTKTDTEFSIFIKMGSRFLLIMTPSQFLQMYKIKCLRVSAHAAHIECVNLCPLFYWCLAERFKLLQRYNSL